MAKTGFENLRLYQLAEEIADLTWEVVIRWDGSAQVTAKMTSATDPPASPEPACHCKARAGRPVCFD